MSILFLQPPPTDESSGLKSGSSLQRWLYNIYSRLFIGIKFSVHKNGSDQSITNNTETLLTWPSLETDSVSGFDTTNNKYICKETGVYNVKSQAKLNTTLAASKYFTLRLYKNSTIVAENIVSNIAIDSPTLLVVKDISLNINDSLSIKVQHTNGSSANIEGDEKSTFFQAHRIN
jgi:hypothetical protein